MPPRKRGGKTARGRASKSAAKSKSPLSAAAPELEPQETSAAAPANAPELETQELSAAATEPEVECQEPFSTAVTATELEAQETSATAAAPELEAQETSAVPVSDDAIEPAKPSEDLPAAADVAEPTKPLEELPGDADVAAKPSEEPTVAADVAEAVEVNAAANEPVLPSEEPPVTADVMEGPADSSTPRKVAKVKKVVKKKIIVKKVPKGSTSCASTKHENDSHPQLDIVAEADESASVAVQMDEGKDDVLLEDKSDDKNAQPVDETATIVAEVAEDKDASLLEEKEHTVAPMEEKKSGDVEDDEKDILDRRRRRKTEIFIGGLDRDAKEEDIRKVFSAAGEIVEVRMIIDSKTGKNKGYAFCRYADHEQAKQAVNDFKKVEIRGKQCGAAALEGNDTIFLGNIDKTWKKDDVMKFLKEIGIEKIDAVTVMADPNNTELNRGFAFLELETYKDAQVAYRSLKQKDLFAMGHKIKFAWAEQFNDQDGEEVDMKVSLAKPVQKGKQIKGGSRHTFKADKPKPFQRQPKVNAPLIKGKFSRSSNTFNYGERFTANHHMMHPREPVAWKQGHMGYSQGPAVQDYTHPYYGGKRTFSSRQEDVYPDTRGYPRARMDSSYPVAGTSYDPSPYNMSGPSMTYYQRPPSGYQSGEFYGSQSAADYRPNTYQPRQGGAPHGSGFYPRY